MYLDIVSFIREEKLTPPVILFEYLPCAVSQGFEKFILPAFTKEIAICQVRSKGVAFKFCLDFGTIVLYYV